MERRYDLDWVRIAAFFLLVLYHTGMYYVSWDWHVKSPYASETLEPLMLLSSPWRLSLLFLVSGVATAFLFRKASLRKASLRKASLRQASPPAGAPARWTQGFVAQRSWRLLVPLFFGMAVVVVPQAYYEVVERMPGGFRDGYLAFWARYLQADGSFCREGDCLILPTWNHLWFVAYLWAYTLPVWALLRFAPGLAQSLGAWLERRLSGLGLLVWPALALASARILLVERFESTHALVDDWYNHAQYLPLFLLGALMAMREGFWAQTQRLRWPAAVAAGLGYAFIVWYFYGSGYSEEQAPPDALRMIQRLAWGSMQWTTIVAILGFARGIAFRDGPALRYLREAVFPIYILHQTIIIVLAHNAQPLGLRPAIEGPLLIVATFALCFIGFELVRRVGWLRPLFGLRPAGEKRDVPADRRIASEHPRSA